MKTSCTDEIEPSTNTQAAFGITQTTMRRLLSQPSPANAIALYAFLLHTANRQRTLSTYATEYFIARGLKWSRAKVGYVKKQLIALKLVESIARRDAKGRVLKHYLRVRFSPRCPDAKNPDANFTTSGEFSGNAIDKNLNALVENGNAFPQSGENCFLSTDSRLDEFLNCWMTEYRTVHDCDATPPNRHVQRNLADFLDARSEKPAALVEIARLAWSQKGYAAKNAKTIFGFIAYFDAIQAEVGKPREREDLQREINRRHDEYNDPKRQRDSQVILQEIGQLETKKKQLANCV